MAGVTLIIATLLLVGAVARASGDDPTIPQQAFVSMVILWGVGTGLALMCLASFPRALQRRVVQWMVDTPEQREGLRGE